MATQATAVRELLLAAERDRQPLDEPMRIFSRALRLPQLDEDPQDNDERESPSTNDGADDLTAKFLAVHPQGELLLRVWPEQHGAGGRWERRESFAVFLQVAAHLLQAQQRNDAQQAETFALRLIREKSAALEKLLSWSDKPLIEFRALQLLGVLAQLSGVTARELVRLFHFQCPAFVKMATRRWKKPEAVGDAEEEEMKEAPFQLRQAYVDVVLALTACSDKSVRRFAMKEGGVTASLFKSMDGDSSELLTSLFARMGELVLHNPEVELKSKLVIYNGTCVHQLLALLQVEDEGVRETALGVLNALFFEDGALYVVPTKQALRLFLSKSTAASSSQDDEAATTSEQMYAVKVIRNAIVTIGVNELLHSTQAQTLVMAMLAKYPGLLPEYLAALSVQLEPQPVFRWFCVASLVQKLLSCPLDAVPIGMPTKQSEEAFSSWCSAQSLAARLIAPGNFRKELSRGIQHGNNLVIYSSLGIMEAMLQRYVHLAPSLKVAGIASEVQSELRFLVPSPEALVSLLLKLCTSQERTVALIYVRALTVFRLYLECLPQTMREVKLDFTKTLAWHYLDNSTADSADEAMPAPMQSIIVAEMLRFLLAVDTSRLLFLFANAGSAKYSKLLQMLVLYVCTPSRAVQDLAARVLQRTLLASDIFGQESQDRREDQQNPTGRANEEITFWLESLRQSGGKTCANFMEQIMRSVMADPLMYVAIGSGLLTGESTSSSLSPMTVALVAFLNSQSQEITAHDGTTKPELSAYRADPSAVAFAVRILLALVPTSRHPQQLVKLIASGDLLAEASRTSALTEPEENERVLIDGKKRKRSAETDVVESEDAYSWLKAHFEALASESRVSSEVVTHKKKAKATSTKWYRFSDLNALTTALTGMSPAGFAACWEQIVINCADISESFAPVHHYLSSRGDVDVLSLLAFSSTQPSTKNKQKKTAHKASATEAFIKSLPAHIVLQHILYSITSQDSKEQKSTIATIKSFIKRRVSGNMLSYADASRMCEQMLFFFTSSSQLGFSDHGHEQLCELLLFLLTVVIVSIDQNYDTSTPAAVSRIFYKLRAVATSVSRDLLCRQLSAVEIVALRLYCANDPDAALASLCDLNDLFQRASVPLVAVLASRISSSVCIPLLDGLLQEFTFITTNTPHVVLIECVLASLGDYDISINSQKQYDSFADYKRSKLLTRKLWQLLTSQSSARQASFFTTGFTVLGQLGGIDAPTAMASIENSLVPLVVRSARASTNDIHVRNCTDVLRVIVTAIQCGNDSAAFPMAFEKQLLQHLQREEDERIRCELVQAVYTVFTRISSPDLRQFSKGLVQGCFERMLLSSQRIHRAEIALLKHVTADASGSVDVSALTTTASAIVKKLAKSKQDNILSSTQVLGLLLLLRSGGNESVSVNLLSILLRSGLLALKLQSGQSGVSDISFRFEAIVLMAENAVSVLKCQEEERPADMTAVLTGFAKAREIVEASGNTEPMFEKFVSLTAILLRLVGNDTSDLDYDFKAHFNAVVQHPCFVQSLQNSNNNALRLLLVRVVACLARITANYTRALLQSLLSAYSMSLSRFDRTLRVIFQDFEDQGSNDEELSLASMGFRFGASSTILPSTATSHNDLVDDSAWLLGGGLEQSRVRATIERFPLDREVSPAKDGALLDLNTELSVYVNEDDGKLVVTVDGERKVDAYDPAFLLPMLSYFISSSDLPDAGIVQQGLLGVSLRATSSSAESIRTYAYGILAHMHESLQATTEATSDFKAGRQVYLLLDVFRRAIEEPLEEVPSVLTVFLNDVLGVLTRPTHVLYPQVNHFLLARPTMDLGDVPMFYSLFNSRAPLSYRQERSWLLHALRRGVRRDDDVSLLIRRHVLPMLLSFFTSELADTHTQPLITSIMLEALRTPSGGVYLLTKAALLEWLTSQYLRLGAVTSTSSLHKDKQSASVRGTSSALLLPLMTLFEQALQENVWGNLDAILQHAAALQAANAFAALQTAAAGHHSSVNSERAIKTKLAVVAELVIRRAGSVCSLLVLQQALTAVQQTTIESTEPQTNSPALGSAEVVASSISRWLLQQRHTEAQKYRFSDWAIVLRQVATILAACIGTTTISVAQMPADTLLAHQQRARLALDQIKAVLDELPTLKQLVLTPRSDSSATTTYAPALL